MARPFFRRRKSCPFSGKAAPKIDYDKAALFCTEPEGHVEPHSAILPAWAGDDAGKRYAWPTREGG